MMRTNLLSVSTTTSDRTTPMSHKSSPTQKQAIVRSANTNSKLRYRHDPYQIATNAIVSCDVSSNCSSQQCLDTRTVSPECAPMVNPFQPQQGPCEMSLESHENYSYMAHPPSFGHTDHPVPPVFPQVDLYGQPTGQVSNSTSTLGDDMYFSNSNNNNSNNNNNNNTTNAQSSSENPLSSHYHDMMSKLYDSAAPAQKLPAAVQQCQKRNTKQRQLQKKKNHNNKFSQSTGSMERPILHQDAFALVRFKYETTMYRCNFHVQSGDIVVVEADRGENTGTVEEVTNIVPKFPVCDRVIRLADATETKTLKKQRNQVVVTQVVRKTAKTIDDLNINIIDTEMQADGKKLTVYYSADGYVDFRQLQRNLYRRFQCRIWLVNVDTVPAMEKVE